MIRRSQTAHFCNFLLVEDDYASYRLCFVSRHHGISHWMFLGISTEQHVIRAGHSSTSLAKLLLWLFRIHEPEPDKLFWQLVRWCAFIVGRTTWSSDVSTDVFDAPATTGGSVSRAWRMPMALKEAVAAAAVEGKVGRSARAVMVSATRFKSGSQLANCGGWGGKWRDIYLGRYLRMGQDLFRREKERVWSFATDGVRISGVDCLITTVFSHTTSQAMWLPPMVPAEKTSNHFVAA